MLILSNNVKRWASTLLALAVAVITAIVARGSEAPVFRSPTQAMLHNLYTNSASIVSFRVDPDGGFIAEVDLESGFNYMVLHERQLGENWTHLYSRVFVTWSHGRAGGYVMRAAEPEKREIHIPASRMATGFYKLVKSPYEEMSYE